VRKDVAPESRGNRSEIHASDSVKVGWRPLYRLQGKKGGLSPGLATTGKQKEVWIFREEVNALTSGVSRRRR
jgi:hypothetical protein